MDSFLTVVSKFKGKQSLSCNDLKAIENQDFNTVKKASKDKSWPRFRRPKSSTSSVESINSIDGRSSSAEIANAFDSQLAEIKEKLAMLRQQDVEFYKRIRSLSNSIGELTASRSSLNSFTHSETSAASNGMPVSEDEGDYEEHNSTKDHKKNTGKSVATSFLSEVLDSIPTIKVTSYKRRRSTRRSLRRSDPTIHESTRLLDSPIEPDRHSIGFTDHAYFYGSAEEISTLL